MKRTGRSYAAGTARGSALVLRQPISFYGGVDPRTGEIIDRSHSDLGKVITGRVLVLPGGRGSSSSSSVVAEAIRLGTAPIAIILARPDPIMVVGCLVAQTLYGLYVPMIVCPIEGILDGDLVSITCEESGTAELMCERMAATAAAGREQNGVWGDPAP